MININDPQFVSIVIPCRNEERFIRACLDSIIANDYPKDRLEVLVVDGMSEDRTREIIKRYAAKHPFIMLLDNPRKITPCALNTGIQHAKGEIIMRMDAHATYEKDYISKCVKYLSEYNADNVGGTMITLSQKDTFIGRSIVKALTSRFGVGNSEFRTGVSQHKETDTVFGGCYRREIFDKIGYFNENLASSQDMEFNLRLKKAGGKILLCPDIISYYYARSDFRSFCKNNFRNGVWAVYPMKFTKYIPVRLRHFIPLIFVAGLFGSLVLSFFISIFIFLFLAIVLAYSLTGFYFSSKITIQEKNIKYFFVLPIIFATLHLSYGLGSVVGLLKVLVSKNFWMMRFKRSHSV
ncbi:MAG: glycosyltransferase family 2 protein [Desulfobacterales bacterium]|nr:glycosyltransferase family 2 protein [Desulfobacterales bacterium]